MQLRDHDRTCEHGYRWSHWPSDDSGDPIGDDICPGGAAVDINFEAAAARLHADTESWVPFRVAETVRSVIDAALGGDT